MQRKTFLKGQRVRWKSSSQGYTTKKEGEIVGVIPAGVDGCRMYPGEGFGFHRNHESYVIYVHGRLYWPRVNHLELVQESQ